MDFSILASILGLQLDLSSILMLLNHFQNLGETKKIRGGAVYFCEKLYKILLIKIGWYIFDLGVFRN